MNISCSLLQRKSCEYYRFVREIFSVRSLNVVLLDSKKQYPRGVDSLLCLTLKKYRCQGR